MDPKKKPGHTKLRLKQFEREANRTRNTLSKTGIISKAKVDRLTHDLTEIAWECKDFPLMINEFLKSLKSLDQGSYRLWQSSLSLRSTMGHFEDHFRVAKRRLSEIHDIARAMPPLDALSDDKLTSILLDESYEQMGKTPNKSVRELRKQLEKQEGC